MNFLDMKITPWDQGGNWQNFAFGALGVRLLEAVCLVRVIPARKCFRM
jgi:hypothetical protein